ncbi:M15 family metallopeptidase [Actinoplanes siamensis]|uniref:D-alanyl-D-alanine carboxypeptidase-like core domain-containing protein n=1 Tax=Actinoplanes siamensis TaxID=1223317 RepID=A0A919TK50_9ACTN|nr:M15 family metallopeptidase [Actinoplanes siamensis]GIF04944.1 hypothetical protein Asi03nite_24820 [Actinoplanes siamensis]
MTTRQRTLQKSAAAAIIALAATGSALGGPAPAQAAVPKVATRWSSLMYRSLTHDVQLKGLRTTLAGQQAAVRKGTAEVAAAEKAQRGARVTLADATSTNTRAQSRYTKARKALTAAKQSLTTASKRKPRSTVVVGRANRAVVAATKTATAQKALAQKAATALAAAGKASRGAAARVEQANAAVESGRAAVSKSQKAIAALPAAATLAGQAASLSDDMVAQVRPAFRTTDTTKVYGVTVHRAISYTLKRMIDDARADGVQISGGGFRTKERQIQLRTINGCPDVWTAPASSCRVPTAIPGRSLHEIGLAVDISSGGRTISSKTAAFTWLKANAREYGFVNLPSEAWHWSVTGG